MTCSCTCNSFLQTGSPCRWLRDRSSGYRKTRLTKPNGIRVKIAGITPPKASTKELAVLAPTTSAPKFAADIIKAKVKPSIDFGQTRIAKTIIKTLPAPLQIPKNIMALKIRPWYFGERSTKSQGSVNTQKAIKNKRYDRKEFNFLVGRRPIQKVPNAMAMALKTST